MASEILTTLIGLFCTVVSGIVTFILTKRKYNTEVDSQQIQNMSDSFDIYKKMMEETFNSQNKKIEMLQKENDNLRQQVSQLQMQMINLMGSIQLNDTISKGAFMYNAKPAPEQKEDNNTSEE